METVNTETNKDNTQAAEGDSVQRVVLQEQVNSLSIAAKIWLAKTCELFADGEGYYDDPASVAECIVANLVAKERGNKIGVSGEVMQLVYSEGYIDIEKLENTPSPFK
jgi:hypothetical protein